MVLGALRQSLNKGPPASLALSKLAPGLYNGLGVTDARAQIRWWSEPEGISASGVIFYLISRYMRPEGPWQRLRRCRSNGGGLLHIHFPWPQTDRTGHSCAPNTPKERQKQATPKKYFAPKEKKGPREGEGKIHSRAGPAHPPLPRSRCPHPPPTSSPPE